MRSARHRRSAQLIFVGRDKQISGKIFNPRNAEQAHRQVQLGNNVLDDLANTIRATNGQSVDLRPTDEAGVGAKRQGNEHIGTRSDAAVEQDRRLRSHGVADGYQRIQ